MKAVHEIIVLCTATVMLTAISASIIPQDFQLLKRLLQYKSTNAVSVRNTAPATLAVPITTTELSVIVAQTDNLPVMNDFYNTIYTGNRTVDVKLRQTISAAVPHLQKLAANRTDKLSKQRALVQLAVELQPLIGPIIRSYPNLTANITYPNKGPIINNFNRTARGGYGGGGWGWGGGCCEEPVSLADELQE
ncbi:uncharacterized protein LOC129587184 [Paramacrobiotus metropolitanus]|uniref:uncharacterized protein LOC129587184 n=1 Tax=Paramacrobiotus metropolitanus TaxID=2943436 RepID=UPI0024464B7F|nr:uncharacterized protein LOC129587184 [Paramacrobiotus metropolitanus]